MTDDVTRTPDTQPTGHESGESLAAGAADSDGRPSVEPTGVEPAGDGNADATDDAISEPTAETVTNPPATTRQDRTAGASTTPIATLEEEETTETGSGNTAGTGTDGAELSGRGSSTGSGSREFRRWAAETRRQLARADSARIDVYLRSMLPPPGAKDAQLDVMEELSAVGETTAIDDVNVSVWGEQICLCGRCRETEVGQRMIDTVRRFERWGVEYDASTEWFFERTRQQSSLVGDAHEGIAPPRVTAVLYVDGSIQGVFPAQFESECYSVHDFASALARKRNSDGSREPVERTHEQSPGSH